MVGYIPNKGPSSNDDRKHQDQQQHQLYLAQNFHQHQPQYPHQPHSFQPQPIGALEHNEGISIQHPSSFQQQPLQQTQQYHSQPPTGSVQYIRQFLYQMNPNSSATLKFVKDLELMTRNWSALEIQHSRRLVRFNFTIENYTQFIDFEPIQISQYDNMKPTISCIYWPEMNSYVVTSVDIILLLEYLVHQTFDVEEKNRIRRNLQSLKPNTISKANLNDRNFFNLIMSMENPRPRNIEKDLKVFHWSDLRKAISKVMSKYYVVPSDKANNKPTAWSNNNSLGDFRRPSQQTLASPLILQSPSKSGPLIATATPTPFQYTPIQQQFPDLQSPGYFPRRVSLPNVTLTLQPNIVSPPTDSYMNFNQSKVFDPQAQQSQPYHHNSQPFIPFPTQFKFSLPVRNKSVPHSFHSNSPLPQYHLIQPSPGSFNIPSESKSMPPIKSGDNMPPPLGNTFKLGEVSKGPLDSSGGLNTISTMLNTPYNESSTNSRGTSSNELDGPNIITMSSLSSSNNDIPQRLAKSIMSKRNCKRLSLNDLMTRNDTQDDTTRGGIRDGNKITIKGNDSGNPNNNNSSTRLPSIAHLLNNSTTDEDHSNSAYDGNTLPSMKKQRNSKDST